MNCSICGASARVLETNFHGAIVDCVECGSYVVSADVLKKKDLLGKVVAVQATRLWLVSQRLGHKHRPVITAETVRWE
jgi:uncharacterized Zn finger protein